LANELTPGDGVVVAGLGLVAEGVAEVVEAAVDFPVLDLVVGEGGLGDGIPVDETLAALDQPVLEESEEGLADGAGADLVHREPLAVPVARAAHRLELLGDARLVLVLPGLDPGDELLPPVLAVALHLLVLGEGGLAGFLESLVDHGLGRDAGVVGAGEPERLEALHAVRADEHVLDGVVERVPEVESGGDVGRRDEHAVGGLLAREDRRGVGVEGAGVEPALPDAGLVMLGGVGLGEFGGHRGGLWHGCLFPCSTLHPKRANNAGMAERRDLIGGRWILGALVLGGAAVIVAAIVLRGLGGSGGAAGGPERGASADTDVAELLEAARVYTGQREFAKAETVLRSGVERLPVDHRLREALAEVLLQREDRAGAYEQYAWLVEDGSGSAPVAFAAGSLAAVLGEPARAAAFHARAGELDPGNADYPLHLARAQVEMGEIDEAKASLARAAVLDEGRGIIWGMLGELAFRENRLAMAAEHVTKARRLEPSVVAWRVLEARILKRRGEPERALLLLQGLSGPDRNQAPVLRAMGECLGMLGRPGDALALYEVAIEAVPGEPEFRYEAALWAERLGRTDRALELAREARLMGEARADAVIERLGG
jgi:tetratricopeptide (TPR) repeat protein